MPLDPKVQTLLTRVNAQVAPQSQPISAAEHRATTLAQAKQSGPLPPVAALAKRTIPGPGGARPVMIYTPIGDAPFPLLLYFHGGGFVLPGLPHHDYLCRELCNRVSCVVVVVDYRLAPEAPFPAATDDCLAATRWAAEHALELNSDPTRVAVAGDSSGGALAAVTTLRCRDAGGTDAAGTTSPLSAHRISHPTHTLGAGLCQRLSDDAPALDLVSGAIPDRR